MQAGQQQCVESSKGRLTQQAASVNKRQGPREQTKTVSVCLSVLMPVLRQHPHNCTVVMAGATQFAEAVDDTVVLTVSRAV